ncbi:MULTISPECIES: hypothetical protein [Bradyrhizobium]|uniref:Uncharacterized protein n=1 Tax=Bradyrhizobium xenonodulans TaxID=2736875 RepID=A0ABY7MWV8_9BRAD|nr:hypothetical protein [Bradyrhizobium xenonodulans]WBL82849.1 hypothetical protein I3J27_34635 [Bradyrhizobium xenonodulans]
MNIVETVLGEAHRKPESSFDFVQGTRLDLEGKAKRLMDCLNLGRVAGAPVARP